MDSIGNWPEKQITDFRRQWKITELSLFGSAAHGDSRPDVILGTQDLIHFKYCAPLIYHKTLAWPVVMGHN